MGINFSIPLNDCCCFKSRPSSPSPSSSSSSSNNHSDDSQSLPEPDERTPLIIHEPQPNSSPQSQLNNQPQLPDEATVAANSIVDNTVKFLVNVYDHAPFSSLRVQDQPLEKNSNNHNHHQTPEGSSRSSWRAYDPPLCPPLSPTIQRLRLGYEDSGKEPSKAENERSTTNHKKSFHSLRTIINDQNGRNSSSDSIHRSHGPQNHSKDLTTTARTTTVPKLSSNDGGDDDDDDDEVEDRSRDSCCTTSSQFNTIRTDGTFKTAIDDGISFDDDDYDEENVEQDRGSLRTHKQTTRTGLLQPDFVGNLWQSSSEVQEPTSVFGSAQTDPEYLTDDPKKLKEMVNSGFKLKDTGPIIVEL